MGKTPIYIAGDSYEPWMAEPWQSNGFTYEVVPVRCYACKSGKTYPGPAHAHVPTLWECLVCRTRWSMAELPEGES